MVIEVEQDGAQCWVSIHFVKELNIIIAQSFVFRGQDWVGAVVNMESGVIVIVAQWTGGVRGEVPFSIPFIRSMLVMDQFYWETTTVIETFDCFAYRKPVYEGAGEMAKAVVIRRIFKPFFFHKSFYA